MTEAKEQLAPEMVERVAAIIGREAREDWTDAYRPKVQWPDDFSERERDRLRVAAHAVIAALLGSSAGRQISPPTPADGIEATSGRGNQIARREPNSGQESAA